MNKKKYIKARKHLLPFISEVEKFNLPNAWKISDIYRGIKDEVSLGYPDKDTAKHYGVSCRTKIFLKKTYALHIDNSGHITGKGHGAHAHSDDNPLSAEQFLAIPNIIKTAKKSEITDLGTSRNSRRFSITRKTNKHQFIVIEVSSSKDRIDIVTAYNLSKNKRNKKAAPYTIEDTYSKRG